MRKIKYSNINNSKGITLIALIITIVVLLILAAVTIGESKESDIIGYAQNAAGLYNQKQAEEEKKLKEFEEELEQLFESSQDSFYGPAKDGEWILKTSNRIVRIADDGMTSNEYKEYTVDEAINLLPENEKSEALEKAELVRENYGEINKVIVATRVGTGGLIDTYIFGACVNNNTNFLLYEENKVLELNNNPPLEIKNKIYWKSGTYNTYVLKNSDITVSGIDDAELITVIDNERMGIYIYSKKYGGSLGVSYLIEIQQNDRIINVTLNGENKTIDTTFYKITDSSGKFYYLDSNKEKIYKSAITFDAGVEEGGEVIELEKTNYDIKKVGFIIQ